MWQLKLNGTDTYLITWKYNKFLYGEIIPVGKHSHLKKHVVDIQCNVSRYITLWFDICMRYEMIVMSLMYLCSHNKLLTLLTMFLCCISHSMDDLFYIWRGLYSLSLSLFPTLILLSSGKHPLFSVSISLFLCILLCLLTPCINWI